MDQQQLSYEAQRVFSEINVQCQEYQKLSSKMDDMAYKIEHASDKLERLKFQTPQLSVVQMIDSRPVKLTSTQDRAINISMGVNVVLVALIVFVFYRSTFGWDGVFE